MRALDEAANQPFGEPNIDMPLMTPIFPPPRSEVGSHVPEIAFQRGGPEFTPTFMTREEATRMPQPCILVPAHIGRHPQRQDPLAFARGKPTHNIEDEEVF